MLKISQVEPVNHSKTLRLEGRLIGPWVEELRQVCEPLLSNGCTIELSLAEVSFVDEDGVKFLKKLIARGVALVGCSLFVEEQLKSAPIG